MKNQQVFSTVLVAMFLAFMSISCGQDKMDPQLVLDEEMIPAGYVQESNPSPDAMTRLEEFRLKNPNDNFYYLKRLETNQVESDWMFPQKELLIEYAESTSDAGDAIVGVIVKKIKGDWRNEEFTYTDSHPQPVGGMQVFFEALAKSIQYPEAAKKEGVQGKVFVEFMVDKNGDVMDVKAVKGIGHGFDEEAVRAVSEAGKWEPSRIMDMSVNTRMILPVSFKLE